MTYEPEPVKWQISPNKFVPIIETEPTPAPAAKPQTDSLTWLTLAVLAIAGVAGITVMLHFGNLLLRDWQNHQESVAKAELARIKTCINQ